MRIWIKYPSSTLKSEKKKCWKISIITYFSVCYGQWHIDCASHVKIYFKFSLIYAFFTLSNSCTILSPRLNKNFPYHEHVFTKVNCYKICHAKINDHIWIIHTWMHLKWMWLWFLLKRKPRKKHQQIEKDKFLVFICHQNAFSSKIKIYI